MSQTALPATAPKWRFRFRLQTLMLVSVIIGLAVAQYLSMREVASLQLNQQRLEAENASLRVEAGHLTVADPNKVSVLQLKTLDDMTWRWKVYVPKGHWKLSAATRSIPDAGLVTSEMDGGFSGGYWILAASVRKAADGRWQLVLGTDAQGNRRGLSGPHALIAKSDKLVITSSGDQQQDSYSAGRPVVLLRMKAVEISARPSTPADFAGPHERTAGLARTRRMTRMPTVSPPARDDRLETKAPRSAGVS